MFELLFYSNETQCIDIDVYIARLSATITNIEYTDEMLKVRPILLHTLVDYTEATDGVPLYISITQNEKPVINASVTVWLNTPDDDVTKIPIQDSGEGEL